MTGVIYKVENLINGKCYIGQTTQYKRRKINHISDSFNKSRKDYNIIVFHKAIRKYGTENFKWSIIWKGNIVKLNEKEKHYIKEYKSYSNGYNMTEGGDFFSRGENNPAFVDNKYTFYHEDGRIEKDITMYDFRSKYNFSSSFLSRLCNGKVSNMKGWTIDNKSFSIIDKSFVFYNTNGIIEKLDRKTFINKYNLYKSGIYNLCSNKIYIYENWYINSEINNILNSTFIFSNKQVSYNLTILEFSNKFNIDLNNILKLYFKDKNSFKGWIMLDENRTNKKIDENGNLKLTDHHLK